MVVFLGIAGVVPEVLLEALESGLEATMTQGPILRVIPYTQLSIPPVPAEVWPEPAEAAQVVKQAGKTGLLEEAHQMGHSVSGYQKIPQTEH